MSRKLRLAFLASLLLNAVLIGVLVGQTPGRLDRTARREQRMETALEGLPADAQARVREKFTQLRSAARPLFGEIRAAQDEALRTLAAEPFDQAAYDLQIAKINQLRVETTDRLAQMAKQAALELSPDERRKFVEVMRRPEVRGQKSEGGK